MEHDPRYVSAPASRPRRDYQTAQGLADQHNLGATWQAYEMRRSSHREAWYCLGIGMHGEAVLGMWPLQCYTLLRGKPVK